MKPPKVAIIIPSMEKNQEYLRLCVDSLRDSGIDWDIIVVTNGGHMYPLEGLRARRIHTSQQGQCHAVNIGAQMVAPNTDYIMISNDDMYYAPGWNRNLRFDDLCFSPNLIEPTNNNGSADPFLKLDAGFTLEEFNQLEVNRFINNMTLDQQQTPIVGSMRKEHSTTGFNFPVFIKKELWDTIGGYDEAYDPWGSNSDTDLQTLIELAGVQPMRLRDVLVYHFSNKSGTFDGTHQEEWWKNFNYYRDKFGYTRDDEPIPDTWMATGMVNHDKLIYKPEWMGKYNG